MPNTIAVTNRENLCICRIESIRTCEPVQSRNANSRSVSTVPEWEENHIAEEATEEPETGNTIAIFEYAYEILFNGSLNVFQRSEVREN